MKRPSGLKVAVLGDQGVGKTTLIRTFCGTTAQDSVDSYLTTFDIKKKAVKLEIFDLPTDEEILYSGGSDVSGTVEQGIEDISWLSGFRHNRHGFMASVFLICFSVDKPDSLEHAAKKWCPEIRHHFANVDVILVACKIDLCTNEGGQSISWELGSDTAKKLGIRYVEISSFRKEEAINSFHDTLKPIVKKWIDGQNRIERRFKCWIWFLICTCCCWCPVATVWEGIRSCCKKRNSPANDNT